MAQTQSLPPDQTSARLDVWLWRARFIKTRSQAARFITAGKVRLTRAGETKRVTKAHTAVRPGDQITFMRAERLFCVQMDAAGTRRGPAPEAQTLYSIITDEAPRNISGPTSL